MPIEQYNLLIGFDFKGKLEESIFSAKRESLPEFNIGWFVNDEETGNFKVEYTPSVEVMRPIISR